MGIGRSSSSDRLFHGVLSQATRTQVGSTIRCFQDEDLFRRRDSRRAPQPEGLPDNSRWSERSVDHRNTYEQNDAPRRGARRGRILCPVTPPGVLMINRSTPGSSLRSDPRLLSSNPSGCKDSSLMLAPVEKTFPISDVFQLECSARHQQPRERKPLCDLVSCLASS